MGGGASSRGLFGLAAAVLALWLLPAPAGAATIGVTTTADELDAGAPCSLREAVSAANANLAVGGCPAGGSGDVISLPPGTYRLARAGVEGAGTVAVNDLEITDSLTVRNAGGGQAVIDGIANDRVFEIGAGAAAEVSLIGLTIRGGTALGNGGGVLL